MNKIVIKLNGYNIGIRLGLSVVKEFSMKYKLDSINDFIAWFQKVNWDDVPFKELDMLSDLFFIGLKQHDETQTDNVNKNDLFDAMITETGVKLLTALTESLKSGNPKLPEQPGARKTKKRAKNSTGTKQSN